jgi:RecB family endonuclease NucS
MSPPCVIDFSKPDDDLIAAGVIEIWRVAHAKTADMLVISIFDIHHDSTHELGEDPGLIKDGVEAHLQRLSAEQIAVYGEGFSLIRREFPTAIGPVDILARDANNAVVAIEIKRRGDIDGVEQLTRYLELLNRDPTLAPVTGIFAAQEIKPQARTLAEDRGIRCVVLDLEELRGGETDHDRLF